MMGDKTMSTIELGENEIRVLQLKNGQIEDFLWHIFRATCRSILSVPEEQDDLAFGIRWNRKNDTLETYAIPFSAIQNINFKEINAFLEHMDDSKFLSCIFNKRENNQWISYDCSKIKQQIINNRELHGNELTNENSVFSKIGGSYIICD